MTLARIPILQFIHSLWTQSAPAEYTLIQRVTANDDNDEFNKRRTNAIKSYRKKEQ